MPLVRRRYCVTAAGWHRRRGAAHRRNDGFDGSPTLSSVPERPGLSGSFPLSRARRGDGGGSRLLSAWAWCACILAAMARPTAMRMMPGSPLPSRVPGQ